MRCIDCDSPPRYVAKVAYSCSAGVYLCEQHAAEERARGDVIEIRSLRRVEVERSGRTA